MRDSDILLSRCTILVHRNDHVEVGPDDPINLLIKECVCLAVQDLRSHRHDIIALVELIDVRDILSCWKSQSRS